MSVAQAVGRVAEIQALLARTAGGPGAAPAGAFAQQLQQASAPAAAGGPQAATASAAAPAPGAAAGGSPTRFDGMINAAAQKHGIDPALLKGLIRAESNFNPKAGSPAGAQGLTQLMPGTARGLGVSNPFDPAQAIEGGAKYLAQQLKTFGGDQRKALAAYNAGPGAVQRYGGIPPYTETRNYVERVLGYAQGYRASAPTA